MSDRKKSRLILISLASYFINPDSLNWGPKYGCKYINEINVSEVNLTQRPDIWAPSCFIAAIYVFFYLPEVKGRTLEEIDEMFLARVPARKFRKYVCTGQAALESKNRNAHHAEDEGKESKDGTVETIERVYGDKKAVAGVVETAVNLA